MISKTISPSKSFNTFVWFLGGVLIGLAISKFSSRGMYQYGYDSAMNNQSEMCSKWWFNNSGQRLSEAKAFICRK